MKQCRSPSHERPDDEVCAMIGQLSSTPSPKEQVKYLSSHDMGT